MIKRYTSILFGLLLFLVFFAPFSTLIIQFIKFSFEHFGHPFSPTQERIIIGWKEIILFLGLISLAVRWIVTKKLPFTPTKLDAFLLIFIAFAVFWGGQHVSVKTLIFGLRYDVSPFLYYILARSVHVSREQLLQYMCYLCYISLPILLFGIAQTLFLPQDLLTHIGYSWGGSVTGNPLPPTHLIGTTVRAMSTFPGPNSLGMYAVLLFFISWFVLPAKQAAVRYGFLALTLTTLAVTFSRGHLLALLSASVIVGFYALLHKKFLLHKPASVARVLTLSTYAALALGLVGILTYGNSHGATSDPAQNIILHNDSTAIHHDVLIEAWDSIKAHPFGSGMGTSGLATTNTGGTVFNPESWYIQIAQDLGWVGLLGALAVLASVFSLLASLLHDLPDNEDNRLALFFTASFIAIAVSGDFLPSWFEATSVIWWVLFGFFVSDYLASLPRSTAILKSHKKA